MVRDIGLIKIPHVWSLSMSFVYTLSMNVLAVSHNLVGNVIFGANSKDITFS